MNKFIFATGATGFVGSHLVKRLSEDESVKKIYLLVRGNSKSDAEIKFDTQIHEILSYSGKQNLLDKIEVFTGDVTKQMLGLSDSDYSRLANSVTHIIHCAANVSFDQTLESARKTNYTGTRNILEFASFSKKFGNLKKIAYVGTAFVSGNKEGTIYEDDLALPKTFANSYEQSKFETEKLVRSYMDRLPLIIFRPSIIIGDSKSGFTTSFNVMYHPLKLICKGYLKFLPGSKGNVLDIVPIDYVTNSICYLLQKYGNEGKTYHLTSSLESPVTLGEIISLLNKYFLDSNTSINVNVVFIHCLFYKMFKVFLCRSAKKINNKLSFYAPYIILKRKFDNSNSRTDLEGSGISVPSFSSYYKNIYNYCILSNWGKYSLNAA